MKLQRDLWPVFVLATLAAAATVTLAVAPAYALTRAEFEAARGSYALDDGRTVHLGGSPRRPHLQFGDGTDLVMTDAGEGQIVTPDGRLEVQLIVHANGLVSGLQLTQRR